MTALRLSVVLACAAAMLWSAPTALAAPPPNDARAGAQALQLPASVRGTTVQATVETAELPSSCNATKNSVWYAFTADTGRSIVIALDAEGDIDGDYQVGDVVRFPAPDGQSIAGIVRDVDDDAVVFDFNHPFAGRAVTFDVKLIGVL